MLDDIKQTLGLAKKQLKRRLWIAQITGQIDDLLMVLDEVQAEFRLIKHDKIVGRWTYFELNYAQVDVLMRQFNVRQTTKIIED